MIWAVLGFAFAALGSKVLLGLAIVYVFIPDSRQCSRCDADTAVVEAPRGLRIMAAWVRVQCRWCPRCGEHFLARGANRSRIWVGAPPARPPRRPAGPSQAFERRPQ